MKIPREPLVYVLPLLCFETSSFIYAIAGTSTIMGQYYHLQSTWQDNVSLLLFPLMFLVVSPFSVSLARKIGLEMLFHLCLALAAIASIMACFAAYSYGFILAASFCASIVAPLIACQSTSIAMNHVEQQMMSLYLGLLTFFSSAGNAFGFLLCEFVINSPSLFAYYFVRIQILFLIILVSGFLILIGPRLNQMYKWVETEVEQETMSFVFAVRQRLHVHARAKEQKHIYMLVGVCIFTCSALNGISNAISYLFREILTHNDLSSMAENLASILFFVPCIVSPLIVGWVLDWTLSTDWIPFLICLGTSLCQIALFWQHKPISFDVLVTTYGLLSNAITSLNLAAVTLITHGKDGDSLNNVYVWLSTFWTLIFTLLFSFASYIGSMMSLLISGMLLCILAVLYIVLASKFY